MTNSDADQVTIPFTCPHCGNFTEVESRFAGQSGPCVSCSNTITIPRWEAGGAAFGRSAATAAKFPFVKLGMVLGGLTSLGVLAVVVWSLLQPAFEAARDAARCSECESNLRRIGQALEDYHNEHNAYPPAMTYDESGKPMHSWRVLILPHLGPEAEGIYRQYDMQQPWDSQRNMQLLNQMPAVYACPSDTKAVLGETSYLAVIGPETVIPVNSRTKTTRRDITDLLSETMVVVECEGSTVNWLEPKDVPVAALRAGLNSHNPAAPGSRHLQGVHALMADQSVVRLRDDISSEDLRGMATMNGDEYIESLDDFED